MNSNKRTSSMDLNPNMDLLLDSTTSLYNTSKFEKSSDEDIEKLLKKMENLLSPHDHSVFDSNGNKSVGDILKAADELIHSSSPLFEALSPTDSQNISGTSHISSKSFKIDIPQLPVFNKSFSLKSNDINTDANETKRITNKVTPDTPQENDNVDNNINVTPANPIANINKENMTLDIENKNTPAMKLKEENPKPNNVNESNINNVFQFQDIVNLTRPDKPSGVSTTKPHSKYDKHRQLNYKTDRDKKVKTSQLIPKHKSENSRAKSGQDMKMKNTDPTKESSKIVKQQTSLEKNVDKKKSPMLNNEMKNTSQTNIEKNNEIENFPSPNKKLNLDEQNVNMPHTNKNNDSTLHSVGHLTSQNTLLKTNNEPGHDLESDIHSLTRTLSPTTESHWSGGLRDVTINNGKPELKMSDLVTPSRGSQSLEQELEIQKNKVRQLKDELNNTVKFHLQQLESMKISHEEELVMMKRQMKVEQETELKRRLLTRTPGMDKATTPLDDHLLSSYDKENKRLCQEIKSLKTITYCRFLNFVVDKERGKITLAPDF
ncbi:hypothetical protein M8J75_010131 [Diaphorina citri]|nr:hypothetical protein M8J75_010131 [Diaphorina citri]